MYYWYWVWYVHKTLKYIINFRFFADCIIRGESGFHCTNTCKNNNFSYFRLLERRQLDYQNLFL